MKNPPAEFQLLACEVPHPPGHGLWVDALRWLICVMNSDDTSLFFIASVYSHALKNDGFISDRQSKAAQKIRGRVEADYYAGVLDCQMNDGDVVTATSDLLNINVQGEA